MGSISPIISRSSNHGVVLLCEIIPFDAHRGWRTCHQVISCACVRPRSTIQKWIKVLLYVEYRVCVCEISGEVGANTVESYRPGTVVSR